MKISPNQPRPSTDMVVETNSHSAFIGGGAYIPRPEVRRAVERRNKDAQQPTTEEEMNQNQNEPTTINDEFYEDDATESAEPNFGLAVERELNAQLEGDLEFIRKYGRVINRFTGLLLNPSMITAEDVTEFELGVTLIENYYSDSVDALQQARKEIDKILSLNGLK